MKSKKTGGRAKGTPNKKTDHFFDLCEKLGHDPVEFNILVAMNKWQELGYTSETVIRVAKSGETYEEDRVTITDRMTANNKLLEFMYPKRKAIEITSDDPNDKGKGVVVLAYNKESLQASQKKSSDDNK